MLHILLIYIACVSLFLLDCEFNVSRDFCLVLFTISRTYSSAWHIDRCSVYLLNECPFTSEWDIILRIRFYFIIWKNFSLKFSWEKPSWANRDNFLILNSFMKITLVHIFPFFIKYEEIEPYWKLRISAVLELLVVLLCHCAVGLVDECRLLCSVL